MGGRLLRRWLLFPLVDVARIRRRQDAVERLVGGHAARDAARKHLGEIADLERLVGARSSAWRRPRDLVALGARSRAARAGRRARDAAAGEIGPMPALGGAGTGRVAAGDAASTSAPISPSSGDLAGRAGRAAWCRRCAPTRRRRPRTAASSTPGSRPSSTSWSPSPAAGATPWRPSRRASASAPGSASLKVKYNSVFGYYIEVTRAQLAHAGPGRLRRASRRSPTASASSPRSWPTTRRRSSSADERRVALEVRDLRTACAPRWRRSRRGCWRWRGASPPPTRWRRWPRSRTAAATAGPMVDDSGVLDIADGRHPVVERLARRGRLRAQRRPPRRRRRADPDRAPAPTWRASRP